MFTSMCRSVGRSVGRSIPSSHVRSVLILTFVQHSSHFISISSTFTLSSPHVHILHSAQFVSPTHSHPSAHIPSLPYPLVLPLNFCSSLVSTIAHLSSQHPQSDIRQSTFPKRAYSMQKYHDDDISPNMC